MTQNPDSFNCGDSADETPYDATLLERDGVRRALSALNDFELGRSDEYPEPS